MDIKMNKTFQHPKLENITAIIVLSLAVLFYLYEFAIRTMPSVMVNDLMRDFGITAAGLGVLSSLFYYGYSIMQIPVGLLFDKFSARLLIISAMLATTLATLLFGFATNIYLADIAYFIIGFAASFGFIGALVLASRWFPSKHYTFIVGLVQFTGSIGAILGQQPIAVLVDKIGWRYTAFIAVIVGMVIVVLMYFFIKDHKPNSLALNQMANTHVLQGLKQVLKKKQTWWVGAYSFASWTPVIIFTGLWGIPFLMTAYQTNAAVAAEAMTAAWLGIAISCPILGWWTDRMHYRRPLLIACSLIGIITSAIIIYIPHLSWPVLSILLFLLGSAAAGQSLSFGVVQDINPPKMAGTAIAFNNMAIIIGGVIFPPLVGYLLKLQWDGEMLHNVPIYSLKSYQFALFTVPLCYIVGLLVAIFRIQETHCRPLYEKQD